MDNFQKVTVSYYAIDPMDLLKAWKYDSDQTEYTMFLEENNLTNEVVKHCIEVDDCTSILNALIKSAKECSLHFCSQCCNFVESRGYIHHAEKCINCARNSGF